MKEKREGLFSHTLSDKDQKKLMIFDLIRKKGSVTRLDISNVTDINLVSISNYLKKFLDKKLILETVSPISTGGRKPEMIELNTKAANVIGVDIGESEIRLVMADLALNVVGKVRGAKPAGGKEAIIAASMDLLQQLCGAVKVGMDEILAIGIGLSVDDDGQLRSAIEAKSGKTTFTGSAASCAAFGEKKLNLAADVENLLYMHSDIGCGIVVRGDIYFGAENVFLRDSRYLGPWATDLRITEIAKEEIEKGIGTKMVALTKGSMDNLSLDVVVKAALEQDDIALSILQNTARNLGIRIAYLVNLFNPEVVVIGGGMDKAGDIVLDPIRKMVKKYSFKEQAEAVKVIPSSLGEEAVSIGAASLTAREMFLKE